MRGCISAAESGCVRCPPLQLQQQQQPVCLFKTSDHSQRATPATSQPLPPPMSRDFLRAVIGRGGADGGS